MATAVIGKLDSFKEGDEKITEYLERVELYFDANDIKEEKKVPVLLSATGAKTYGLIRSLVTPAVPKDMSFEEISKVFEPKPISCREVLFLAKTTSAWREHRGLRGRAA